MEHLDIVVILTTRSSRLKILLQKHAYPIFIIAQIIPSPNTTIFDTMILCDIWVP